MTRSLKYIILSLCMKLFFFNITSGQTANKFEFERIEDNSFLIEEAYNQDAGVIQHISSFQYMNNHTWFYTFTDEWPVPRQKHQLSATIPVLSPGKTGFGDVLLNYRYQAIFMNRFAFSPRFSFIIPTGNYRKGLGSGTLGYQLSFPFSFLLSTKFVTHYNVGVTYTPGTKNANGSRVDMTACNYGLSVILLLYKNFNLLMEAVGTCTKIKGANEGSSNSRTFLLNPGFRYAINFKSGLQIVPGLAIPVGLGPSKRTSGLFAYLSFEHPLWKP
jgi:hypothetical protein